MRLGPMREVVWEWAKDEEPPADMVPFRESLISGDSLEAVIDGERRRVVVDSVSRTLDEIRHHVVYRVYEVYV